MKFRVQSKVSSKYNWVRKRGAAEVKTLKCSGVSLQLREYGDEDRWSGRISGRNRSRQIHGGDYEEYGLLGCNAVYLRVQSDVSEELIASIFKVEE
jgi:hypothetical protein